MSLSAFDEYDGYARQRVAVACGGDGWSDLYQGTYAIGFVMEDGAVHPDDVRTELMAALRPADLVVEDRRTEHDWGASGPVFFDLLIGVAGSLSASVLFATVQGLIRRARRSDDLPELEAPDANRIWHSVERFVGSALRAGGPRLSSIEHRGNHWYVRGDGLRGEFEAAVDNQGEIVIARLVEPNQRPLTWPPDESS